MAEMALKFVFQWFVCSVFILLATIFFFFNDGDRMSGFGFAALALITRPGLFFKK